MIDWLKELYTAPLRLLAVLVELFSANRRRVKALMAKPFLSLASRALVILTALVWLLVYLFGDNQQGERLNEWVRELWQAAPSTPTSTDPPVTGTPPGQ